MKAGILATLMVLAGLAGTAAAQQARLDFRSRPVLVDCLGHPCFRLSLGALDESGQPVDLRLDSNRRPLGPDGSPFAVFEGDQNVPIILAQLTKPVETAAPRAAPRVPRSQQRGHVSLVLVDTSGSMNDRLAGSDTKFAVARRQLERLFDTFQDSVDLMAIAPFDSHRVVERIKAAAFETTKAGLQRQVAALPLPTQGNTALFSAMYQGLQQLLPFVGGNIVSLIVLTDGKNDVGHASDDPGLLAGDGGLRRVLELAREANVTIYTIGYGAPGTASLDEAALRSLVFPPNSPNYFNASDEDALKRVLSTILRRNQGVSLRLLVGPLQQRREQLAGASLVFKVTAGSLTGDAPTWVGNPLGTPPPEGELTRAEREALLRVPPASSLLPPVVMRLLVLVVYSVLLAALWFGLPRLIWPERYVPKPALRPAAAAAQPRGVPRPPSAPPPGTPARPDRPGAGPRPAPPGPARPADPHPGPAAAAPRGRPPAVAPPHPRQPSGEREVTDTTTSTVFIPPPRRPGGPA